MILKVIQELRPHVLLVHAPYDYLSQDICDKIRKLGTKIIGLTLDDDQFANTWGQKVWDDFHSRFDLWITTANNSKKTGAIPILWTISPESIRIDDPAAPFNEVVFMGNYSKEREKLIELIAAKGIAIACYGKGWMNGSLTRPSRLGVMRRTKLIIIPYDPGSIFRVVEAALIGVKQIIEFNDHWQKHFVDTLPTSYTSAEECAEIISNNEVVEWKNIPTWEKQWPELMKRLTLEKLPNRSGSHALEQLYIILSHTYEQQRNFLGMMSCLDAWSYISPEDWGPKFARLRIYYKMQNWEKIIELSEEIRKEIKDIPYATQESPIIFPSNLRGLGESHSVNPTVEIEAMRLYAFLKADQVNNAVQEIKNMSLSMKTAIRKTAFSLMDFMRDSQIWEALNQK
ncbi:hypothetical protein UAMX_000614 [Candidatus Uabimicrobium amorphum]|nr:hypothetical protein [Candidatus Uabimicrobium amorphum]